MRPSLQTLCEAFIVNRDTIKRAFRLENSALYPVCANIFCARQRAAEEEQLKACRDILRSQTGIFSSFRGTLTLPISCLLAVSPQPEETMARALANYRLLKEKFWGSEYLALAAFLLAGQGDLPLADVAVRGKALYQRMKQEHPFLTGSEDSIFALLLALSEKDDDALIRDMEESYQLLRDRFHAGNEVQAVSHVLTLAPGNPEEKACRVVDLYDAILASGGKYRRDHALSTLAALAMLSPDTALLASDMADVDAFLARQKGYGGLLGEDRRTRMLHSAMIVSDEYAPRDQVETASITGALALIAAEQAALCACMAASTASQASNSH